VWTTQGLTNTNVPLPAKILSFYEYMGGVYLHI